MVKNNMAFLSSTFEKYAGVQMVKATSIDTNGDNLLGLTACMSTFNMMMVLIN